MPRAQRTSCDRCHAQKLKCQKQHGTKVCSRCMKAGVTCVFSTPSRAAVCPTPIAGTTPPAPAHVQHDAQVPVALQDIEMQFDWPSMTLDTAWEPPLPELMLDLPHGPDSAASSSEPTEPTEPMEAPKEDLRSSIVRRLSKLATDFDQLYPSASIEALRHVPNDESIRDYATKWGKEHNQQESLEQLFASSQQLLDIYTEAMRQIFKKRDQVDCRDPGCIHHEPLPAEFAHALGLGDDDSDGLENIDCFLFDHLHLCHSRLNALLGGFLTRFKLCSLISARNPVLVDSDFHIPKLTVGNHLVVSAHTATSMQAVFLVHIATTLVSRAQQLREKTVLATQQVKTSKARLLGLRCDVLVEESESRLKILKMARDHVSELRSEQ